MAMAGTWPPRSRGSWRIRRRNCRPSRPGIDRSLMKTVGTNSGRSAIAASALEYTLTTAPQCSSVSPTSARVSSLSSIRKACTPVRSGQANASEAACRADSRALFRALRLPTRPPLPRRNRHDAYKVHARSVFLRIPHALTLRKRRVAPQDGKKFSLVGSNQSRPQARGDRVDDHDHHHGHEQDRRRGAIVDHPQIGLQVEADAARADETENRRRSDVRLEPIEDVGKEQRQYLRQHAVS